MGLLDGGGAAMLASVFRGVFRDATLRKAVQVDDGFGGLTETYTDHPVKVQRDEFSSLYRTQANIPSGHAKFIVLRPGATAEPALGDLLVYLGASWRVADVISRDPAGASTVVRCAPE